MSAGQVNVISHVGPEMVPELWLTEMVPGPVLPVTVQLVRVLPETAARTSNVEYV